MRIFKWLLGIVVVLAAIFFAGGFLLPKDVTVARSIEIDAPAEQIFPYVNSLKAGADWSPWLGRDPEVQLTYSGPDKGVGAKLNWASEHPQVGSGSQEISLSEQNSKVVTALDFGDMGNAVAQFNLVETAGKTTVTWDLATDMGNTPMGRWMGLMMDTWVGGDYETGLANLKALIEG
jgi:hypothetical protein